MNFPPRIPLPTEPGYIIHFAGSEVFVADSKVKVTPGPDLWKFSSAEGEWTIDIKAGYQVTRIERDEDRLVFTFLELHR